MGELLFTGIRGEVWMPTEDDLPYSDGIPMEGERHVRQMDLLRYPLELYWADRQDFYVGANMFVYYSSNQVRNKDFTGPDVFVALGVPRRERKSWVVWQEGKGPDLVIELLSETTMSRGKGEKLRIYQDSLRVPEYFWYDPFEDDWAGFILRGGVYQPILPDSEGRLRSQHLGLALVRWEGEYQGVHARWLRWTTLDGTLLPTPQEAMEQARQDAQRAERKARTERQRAGKAEQRAGEAERRAGEAEQAAATERQRAEAEQHRAEAEQQRAERLAARLRELGVELDS